MAALPPGAQAALRRAIAAGFMPLDSDGIPDLDLVERLCSTPSTGSTGALAAAAAAALPAPAAPAAPAAAAPPASQILTANQALAAAAASLPQPAIQVMQPAETAPASSAVAGGTPQPSAAPATAPSTSAANSAESRPPLALQRAPGTAAAVAAGAAAAVPAPTTLPPPPLALAQLVPAAAAAAAGKAVAGRPAPPADDSRMKSRAIQARYRQRQKVRTLGGGKGGAVGTHACLPCRFERKSSGQLCCSPTVAAPSTLQTWHLSSRMCTQTWPACCPVPSPVSGAPAAADSELPGDDCRAGGGTAAERRAAPRLPGQLVGRWHKVQQ